MNAYCPPTSRFPKAAGPYWLVALLLWVSPAAAQLPPNLTDQVAADGWLAPAPRRPLALAAAALPEQLLAPASDEVLMRTSDAAQPLAPAPGAHGVATSGRTAYVLNYERSQLVVFAVRAAGRLVPLGWMATGAGPYSLALSGNTAYVVSEGSDTVQLFDVRDPAHPVLRPQPPPLLVAAPSVRPTR